MCIRDSNKMGFLQKAEARKKVMALSEKYGLRVDPDALISDISVGMQQRVEILKMLYRDNEILIFDEPTAMLTPQEIDELMEIMRGFKKEGKSILFITHKLNEIMAVADRCTVLRKGKYMGTVDTVSYTHLDVYKRQMWPTKRCLTLHWKLCSSVSIIPAQSRRTLPWSLLIP